MATHALVALLGLLLGQEADDSLLTVAERSDYRATARYDDVMGLCKRLAASSKSARLEELGKSAEGRPIPLLILADSPVRTPEEARRSGKLVVLVIANIHAGEVCGKEALPMLAREILGRPDHPLLEDLILALVPIYNADGNERVSKDNRPGQVGPEEGMGQRANAQGLDLNRDFVKLEAPETRALVAFLNEWNPHFFIDIHTTNGSHHRYTVTYQGAVNPAGDARLIDFTRKTLFPGITEAFRKETGHESFFYGNFDRDHARWTTYGAQPRFGTSYFGLRNRLSILSEAYAYAPYKTRVLATRDFVRACLEFAADHKAEIRTLLDEARGAADAAGRDPGKGGAVAIRSEARAFPEPATVLGYVEEERDGQRVATDEPKDYRVELVQDFAPTATVERPFAYLVPPAYRSAIENLRLHGIEVEELREDIDLDVEAYRVRGIKRAARSFEGHKPILDVDVEPDRSTRRVEAGTRIVSTDQPLGTLAVYLLEPRSDDGLATWNFFDEGLKEGADFPVLRLAAQESILTAEAADAPARSKGDEGSKRPITFESLRGAGGRSLFGGSPTSVSWLDADHWLQRKDGQVLKVEARTGKSSPFVDADALAKAFAALPSIGEEAARSLARRPPEDLAPGRQPSFLMAPDKRGGLYDYEGDLYYATFDGKTAVRLTETPGEEEEPSFSPDGRFVAFLRDNDLHVVDLQTQRESVLTRGGTDTLRNGKADWVYYEEIFNRNWKAYWWSPDSSRIAFLQFDDSPVGPHAVLVDVGGKRVVEQTPYPRAGDPNPRVKLGVVAIRGGEPRWANLSGYPEGSWIVSDVGWWPGGQSAIAYIQDRTQTWLDVLRIPAAGGEPKRLFRETTKAWVESTGMPQFLDDGTFLFLSERDGWRHLYHYAADGMLKRQVTSGDWEIRAVHHVDKSGGSVLFSATKDNPIAANLYRVRLDNGSPERLTSGDGAHSVSASPDGRLFVDTWSDLATPPRVKLGSADGQSARTIDTNPVPALDEYRFGPRRRVQIPARDGFLLEGELILPPDLDEDKLYPIWFETYGGPHAPTVTDSWAGGRAQDQAMASEGFVVFRMDPRSASGKGAISAWAAYKKLGVKELEDIEDAIAWLKRKPYVDGDRIGMSGHSYGGYMTAFAMTHSKLFAAGIAGAPVTDWHDYDSIYTERYMLTPSENADGYAASSAVEAARDLHGKLLIVHGAMDDNVSIRNTMRFVHALQQADKDFELMVYPASRHGIFSRHYSRLRLDFIRRSLGGPRPAGRAGAP